MNTATTTEAQAAEAGFITREEAAYLLDNYGSLTISTKHVRHADGRLHVHFRPRYRVLDRNIHTLALLQAQFGGSIYHHGGGNYAWELCERTLAEVLREVMAHMRKKRAHAELILRLVELKQDGNDRTVESVIVEELRRLNS